MITRFRRVFERACPRFLAVAVILCTAAGPTVRAQGEKDIALERGASQDVGLERQEIRGLLPTAESYNVLLVTLDHFRVDSVGCYGAKRTDATPNIDAIADKGFRFKNAFAPTDHRLAGVLSIIYGQYPSTLTSLGDVSSYPSIAAHFADRGFYVGAVFSQKTLDLEGLRIGKLSAENDLGFSRSILRNTTPDQIGNYAERLFTHRRDTQVLAWLHIPYTRPPATYHPGFNFGSTPEDHYAAAVRSADEVVGRVWSMLKANGMTESTIVVIAGATGNDPARPVAPGAESLSEAALRVPLVVHVPGLKGRAIDEPVETVDIIPTLLTLLDKTPSWNLQGRSFAAALLPQKKDAEKRPRRMVYAERLALDSDPESVGRQSVSDGKSRAVVDFATRTVRLFDEDKDPGLTEDLAKSKKDVAARLGAACEEMSIYTNVCVDIWKRGEQRAPDMAGTERDLARARWLTSRNDKRAGSTITNLLSAKGVDQLAALELLCQVDAKVDTKALLPFLESTDYQVRALAGAYLARRGDANRGLQYAVQGLRAETPAHRLIHIFNALGESKAPEALQAIDKFKLTTEDRAVIASRELARARLGDVHANEKLVEFIVEPNASYAKKPFIDRLLAEKSPRAERVLRLCLTDGDNSSETVGLVLDGLESLDARGSARAVAGLFDHPDRLIRRRAESLLVRWGDLSLYRPAVGISRKDESEIDGVARTLLALPGLIGSTLLPGVRLGAWAKESQSTPPKMLADGLPAFDATGIVFRVHCGHTDFKYIVVTFKKTEGGPNPELGTLRASVNDRTIAPVSLQEKDGVWVWVGRMLPAALEPGQNQFHLRMQRVDREVVPAYLLNFFLLPNRDVTALPLAAVETTANLPSGKPTLSSPIDFPREKLEYHLYYRVSGPASGGGLTLRVSAGDRRFADVSLPKTDSVNDRVIELGPGPWRLKDAKLTIEGQDAALTAQTVVAVLYAVPPAKD